MRMGIAAVLLCLACSAASAHTLSPPNLKRLFVNGQTILRVQSTNMFDETRDFRVTLWRDRNISKRLGSEYWNALPVGFRSGPGEERTITIRIKDDGRLKEVYVCTESDSLRVSSASQMGVLTRVCSRTRLYRQSDFAKPSVTQRAAK